MIARSGNNSPVLTTGREPTSRERWWRYLPLVLWTGFIFYASTENMSAANTSRLVRPVLRWLFPEITEEGLLYAHFLVRKAAHCIEYAILAWLVARALRASSRTVVRDWWFALAFGYVALVALLDEFHQSLLAARTGSIYDSFLDITSGAITLTLFALWHVVSQKRAGRRRTIS